MTIEALGPFKPEPILQADLKVPAPKEDKPEGILVKASRRTKPIRDIASLGKEGFGLL